MLMKEIPVMERPRERLCKVGASELSNEELLAIILKSGTATKSAKTLAMELLMEVGTLPNLKNETIASLTKIKGLGKVKAIELLATIELGKRIFLEEEIPLIKMNNPKLIWEKTKYLFKGLKQEHFYCFYLNTKQELIAKKRLFVGTLNHSVVHPREIFKEAYLNSASMIICIHNHPSGNVLPSDADRELTKALVEIGQLNGIPIVDHLIVSDYHYYSFYEEGKIGKEDICISERKN